MSKTKGNASLEYLLSCTSKISSFFDNYEMNNPILILQDDCGYPPHGCPGVRVPVRRGDLPHLPGGHQDLRQAGGEEDHPQGLHGEGE